MGAKGFSFAQFLDQIVTAIVGKWFIQCFVSRFLRQGIIIIFLVILTSAAMTGITSSLETATWRVDPQATGSTLIRDATELPQFLAARVCNLTCKPSPQEWCEVSFGKSCQFYLENSIQGKTWAYFAFLINCRGILHWYTVQLDNHPGSACQLRFLYRQSPIRLFYKHRSTRKGRLQVGPQELLKTVADVKCDNGK